MLGDSLKDHQDRIRRAISYAQALTREKLTKPYRKVKEFCGNAYFKLVFAYAVVYTVLIIGFSAFYFWKAEGLGLPKYMTDLCWFDAAYFSVVTVTSLGYGEITPQSWPMKLAVMFQVVFGLLTIGGFLAHLSMRHSKIQQERMQEQETKRLDRQQFSSFVKVVHRLTVFIDRYASKHLRPAQNHDWLYYTFGSETSPIPPSVYERNSMMGLSLEGQGEIQPRLSDGWEQDMQDLSKELEALVLSADPPIFDEAILKEHNYIQRLLSAAQYDMPGGLDHMYDQTPRQLMEKRCDILCGVVDRLRLFRDLFLAKAEPPVSGAIMRNYAYLTRLPDSDLPYTRDFNS